MIVKITTNSGYSDNSKRNSISKEEAIQLCMENGLDLSKPVTFASKNKSTDSYWANPYFDFLSRNWWILLNDTKKYELHVFYIPANSISKDQMEARTDKLEQIQMNIIYEDVFFEDKHSGIKFAKWLVKTVSYSNNNQNDSFDNFPPISENSQQSKSGKITQQMVEAVWDAFKEYNSKGGDIDNIIKGVAGTTGMNSGSAFIYLNILDNLITGEPNIKNMKMADLEYYMSKIKSEYDGEKFKNALNSLEKSIPYWEQEHLGNFPNRVKEYLKKNGDNSKRGLFGQKVLPEPQTSFAEELFGVAKPHLKPKNGNVHVIMINGFVEYNQLLICCDGTYTERINIILSEMQKNGYEIIDVKFNAGIRNDEYERYSTLIMYK